MFQISKQSDYGLLFLEQLIGAKKLVPLSQIVQKTKLPQRFLARIAAVLVKSGLVKSIEGKNGGYQINYDKLQKTNLFDYLCLFENDLKTTECFADSNQCQCFYKNFCHHHSFFNKKLTRIFINELKRYRLLKVLSRRHLNKLPKNESGYIHFI